jgi:hypothetical protein
MVPATVPGWFADVEGTAAPPHAAVSKATPMIGIASLFIA